MYPSSVVPDPTATSDDHSVKAVSYVVQYICIYIGSRHMHVYIYSCMVNTCMLYTFIGICRDV